MIEEVPQPPAGLVEVKAVGLTLQAPDEIPSGWTTFRFTNASEMIHLVYMYRVPEGIGIPDQKNLAAVFQNLMDDINGKPHSVPEIGTEVPEWFSGTIINGGPGLTSAGETVETTTFMEPGTYFMECYVKTDGQFHSYNSSPTEPGMVHLFKVSNEDNQVEEPVSTINMTISAEDGIKVAGDITPGSHVMRVEYTDQMVHENFVGHDVHLVKLEDSSNLDEIIEWMDWRVPTGLQTPAPTGLFLGGTNELPAGGTAYFSAQIEPGRYALISEVPNADEKGLLVQFEVSQAL